MLRLLSAHCQSDRLQHFQPSIGLMVAQLGPPSLPVPGNCASRISFGDFSVLSISLHVIPFNGTLIRRAQHEFVCPAYFPMSM